MKRGLKEDEFEVDKGENEVLYLDEKRIESSVPLGFLAIEEIRRNSMKRGLKVGFRPLIHLDIVPHCSMKRGLKEIFPRALGLYIVPISMKRGLKEDSTDIYADF